MDGGGSGERLRSCLEGGGGGFDFLWSLVVFLFDRRGERRISLARHCAFGKHSGYFVQF